MEIWSPFAKPGSLTLASYKYPDHRYEFQEEYYGSKEEQSDPKERESQGYIALCVAHGRIHDTREDRKAVEQSSYHEYTDDDEDCSTDDHPDTGEGCLTDCFGVVNKLHTLDVCALEVSRNFLKHVKCTSLINE